MGKYGERLLKMAKCNKNRLNMAEECLCWAQSNVRNTKSNYTDKELPKMTKWRRNCQKWPKVSKNTINDHFWVLRWLK